MWFLIYVEKSRMNKNKIRSIDDVVFMSIQQRKILGIEPIADNIRVVFSHSFKVKRQINTYDEVINAITKVVHSFNVNNLLLSGNKMHDIFHI